VAEIAKRQLQIKVVALLERFMANPAHTRLEVRVRLGLLDELAAELFAITVFLCDDHLRFKLLQPCHYTNKERIAVRFFTIAAKLPMELQIIMCHRVVGSMKQNILHKDSEVAFKAPPRLQ